MTAQQQLDEQGWWVAEHVLPAALEPALLALFARELGERPGVRTGLAFAPVQRLAASPSVRALVEPVLGAGAFAFRATLFDKTAAHDWGVAWHQDRMVPVVERTTEPGFGPWSGKDDGLYVQPPLAVLQRLLAVRVDLDGSGAHNGGLGVVPGSHRRGVLDAAALAALDATGAVVPAVPARGALCLRPLLAHASSRAAAPLRSHRRVVHLEFAPGPLAGVTALRVAGAAPGVPRDD